jgi:hypothetical protein
MMNSIHEDVKLPPLLSSTLAKIAGRPTESVNTTLNRAILWDRCGRLPIMKPDTIQSTLESP